MVFVLLGPRIYLCVNERICFICFMRLELYLWHVLCQTGLKVSRLEPSLASVILILPQPFGDQSVALSFHQFLGYGCLGVCHEGEGREASSGEVHEASFSFSAGR